MWKKKEFSKLAKRPDILSESTSNDEEEKEDGLSLVFAVRWIIKHGGLNINNTAEGSVNNLFVGQRSSAWPDG